MDTPEERVNRLLASGQSLDEIITSYDSRISLLPAYDTAVTSFELAVLKEASRRRSLQQELGTPKTKGSDGRVVF